ncbi:MAG: 3-dehydroquinate synthase [Gemmatimonadaceae bacterium]|nr:3-dehydroquinate synthase [Gemmatimonadaceae bacterium]
MTATVIGRGTLDRLGPLLDEHVGGGRRALLIDATVQRHHGARVTAALGASAVVLELPSGEHHKTRDEWARLTDRLLAADCDRDTVIVAVGGGVTTDLAGFVAATFLRGVPLVSVPTTLLAMVDAAHGGKTGVDTPAGKNLVGAFHEARLVIVDPEVLHTLPGPVWRDGFAEVLKHGVIADADYFAQVESLLGALMGPDGAAHASVGDVVARSIAIKQAIVRDDPREQGRRRTLNFGHTIAHALERVTDFRVSHGAAVAVGMCIEARLAVRLGLADAALPQRLSDVLARIPLPTRLPAGLDVEAMLAATRGDKKRAQGAVRYALPTAIGRMLEADGAWVTAVDDADVRAVLVD